MFPHAGDRYRHGLGMSTIDHDSVPALDATGGDHGPLVREYVVRVPSVVTELGWSVRQDDLVLAVGGDICTLSAKPLGARLRELVVQFPARFVTLDLAEVTFADARAITMLIELDRACATTGSMLIVQRPSAAVERLMQLCGFPNGEVSADATR